MAFRMKTQRNKCSVHVLPSGTDRTLSCTKSSQVRASSYGSCD